MHSAIYQGTVSHRRCGPVEHSFRYSVFMMYLDLDELDRVFAGSWLWSSRRPALARFRRDDYLPGADSLAEAVRQRVEQETGCRPAGPIRMLTNLRYFGYVQNPITCYYCFDPTGEQLEYILLEVTNTPWSQRTTYVLGCDPAASEQRIEFDKAMHVSPFLPMDMRYHWYCNTPAQRLSLCLENFQAGERAFAARVSLQREVISPASLRRVLASYPLMTAKVAGAIYWQAAKLFFIKRVPFYSNPHTSFRGNSQ